jgi:hypothetical protein
LQVAFDVTFNISIFQIFSSHLIFLAHGAMCSWEPNWISDNVAFASL